MVDRRLVVLGGCIVDLISYVKRFPRPGETIAGTNFSKGFGGKGANQCFMAAKLGASTAMIAKLGSDTFGQEYLHYFRDSTINHDHVTMTEISHTSTAAISVTEDGQNNIIYVPGAIMHLTSDDISKAEELIMKAKVLLCTYECPLDTLMTALHIAKKYKVKTVINAAPATDYTYEKVYPLADIICVNEIEAEEATQLPMKEKEDCALIMKSLLSKGCSSVILTLGKKGVVYQSKLQTTYTHIPARSVKAIDSTGAGDAFMGSLVYYLSYYPDLNIIEAIERSCEIATMTVLRKGTQTSFPDKAEIPDRLFT